MERADLLQQLYQNERQPVWVLTEKYKILWMNPAAVERFPKILEEADLREQFPQISFAGAEKLNPQTPSMLLSSSSGEGQMTLLGFFEEECLYVAIWTESRLYHVSKQDTESAAGIQLMDVWTRENISHIFRHLDLINEMMERSEITEGVLSTGRIERNCQQLLRLVYILNGYYNGESSRIMQQDVDMTEYLDEIFREADFYLETMNLSLIRTFRSAGAVCTIDKHRFAAALLGLIDLSAAYAPKGGCMNLVFSRTKEEFCVEFFDHHTPEKILQGGTQGTMEFLPDGRSELQLARLALGFLERVIEESSGRYLVELKNGLHVMIRLPLTKNQSLPMVQEGSSYTVRHHGNNRSGLVSILFSDLEEE